MKIYVAMLVLVLMPVSVYSSTWIDPTFEEALEEASLICFGTVESSTAKETKLRITTLYRGRHKVGDLVTIVRIPHVGHGHEEDHLEPGTEYFFMVKDHEEKYTAFTDTFWCFGITDSQVVFPIRDPLARVRIDRSNFDTFLRLVLASSTKKDAHSFVAARATELVATDPLTETLSDVESQLFALEVLYWFGDSTYSPQLEKFLESPYYHIRWSCVRALSTCGGESAEAAIIAQIDKEEAPHVQSVIGKAIFDNKFLRAKSVLIKAIPKVSDETVHLASNIMNPVFNTLPAPRYSYGAALMKIDGKEGSYLELCDKSEEYVSTYPGIEFSETEESEQ